MTRTKTALVLTGGGARAAYQVGALGAIRDLLPDASKNPFPILCGTSGGAINAGAMAVWAEDFGDGVARLRRFWEGLHTGDVYRADGLRLAASGARWLGTLSMGWAFGGAPRALLDTAPLRRRLAETLDFDRIEQAIASRALHSVSVTCSGYSSGESLCFFQGRHDIEPWRRSRRIAAHVPLHADHLLASSAIPFLFPAVKINREFFGDGAVRQLSPISPAIHLGADRILVIGSERTDEEIPRRRGDPYPSLARIAGHALSGIYADPLAVDLERTRHINRMIETSRDERRQADSGLRPVEVVALLPSRRLDRIAADHVGALPWPVRTLLRGIGAGSRDGTLASYLLFEPPYLRALMELGYEDATACRDELERLLAVPQEAAVT